MTGGLIDLDARPEPGPVPAPGARRRPIMVAATLLAALVAPGGAAPRPPGVVPVMTLGQGITSVTLGTRAFFAAGQGGIRAYGLPSGAELWSRPFTQEVYALGYDAAAGVLSVLGQGAPLTFLDAASGRPLWAAAEDDQAESLLGGAVLTRADDGRGTSTVRLTEIRTGRRLWQRVVGQVAFLAPEAAGPGDPAGPADPAAPVVAITPHGTVVVLRSADGTVLGHGELGVPLTGPAADLSTVTRFVDVTVVGGRLYVSDRDAGRATLSAYSIDPFRRLWRIAGGPAGRVTDCGRVLCVNGDRSVSGVDPAGGRPRWTQPAYATGARYDERTIYAAQPGGKPPTALLDAATGRPWVALGDSHRIGPVILRTGRDGTVRVSAGSPRVLGRVAVAGADRCAAAAGYLACPVIDGRTTVWRLPTAGTGG